MQIVKLSIFYACLLVNVCDLGFCALRVDTELYEITFSLYQRIQPIFINGNAFSFVKKIETQRKSFYLSLKEKCTDSRMTSSEHLVYKINDNMKKSPVIWKQLISHSEEDSYVNTRQNIGHH